jgi:hypothetical protein
MASRAPSQDPQAPLQDCSNTRNVCTLKSIRWRATLCTPGFFTPQTQQHISTKQRITPCLTSMLTICCSCSRSLPVHTAQSVGCSNCPQKQWGWAAAASRGSGKPLGTARCLGRQRCTAQPCRCLHSMARSGVRAEGPAALTGGACSSREAGTHHLVRTVETTWAV